MRHLLRTFAFRKSVDLLARSRLAVREGDVARAEWLGHRSRLWLERHLLLAGLRSLGDYRAAVTKIKANRRQSSAASRLPDVERDGPASVVPLVLSRGGRP